VTRRRMSSLTSWSMLLGVLLAVAGCSRTPSSPVFHDAIDPPTLAEWGVFAIDDGRLIPQEGVVDYELNTPLFSDYAHKLRTVWMPAGTQGRYTAEGELEFPVGTIITKTFYYPLAAARDASRVLRTAEPRGLEAGGRLILDEVRLIETRILVHRSSGWAASTYVWDASQREARLERTGAIRPLTLVDASSQTVGRASVDFDYVVPDVNQCAGCHATDVKRAVMSPIGLKVRHVNRDHLYGGEVGRRNQLEYWAESGRLGVSATNASAAAPPRAASWDDVSASLEARARAYLDINCSHCHNPRGPADTSGLSLEASETSAVALGVCKSPIAAGRGTGNRKFGLVPGAPEESITVYRMASTDPGAMMPELGRALAHEEGVALISRWIAEWQGSRGCDQVTSNSARHSASAARLSRSQG